MANFDEESTVARPAGEACLCPFYFAHTFRAATGAVPYRYVTECRMERVGTMIAEGALSIAEIAVQRGFSFQGEGGVNRTGNPCPE